MEGEGVFDKVEEEVEGEEGEEVEGVAARSEGDTIKSERRSRSETRSEDLEEEAPFNSEETCRVSCFVKTAVSAANMRRERSRNLTQSESLDLSSETIVSVESSSKVSSKTHSEYLLGMEESLPRKRLTLQIVRMLIEPQSAESSLLF